MATLQCNDVILKGLCSQDSLKANYEFTQNKISWFVLYYPDGRYWPDDLVQPADAKSHAQ